MIDTVTTCTSSGFFRVLYEVDVVLSVRSGCCASYEVGDVRGRLRLPKLLFLNYCRYESRLHANASNSLFDTVTTWSGGMEVPMIKLKAANLKGRLFLLIQSHEVRTVS